MIRAGSPWAAERTKPVSVASEPVVVYGTSWCAHSQMVRRFLDRAGVPYRYVDLETNPAAASRLRWLTGGASHPTVQIGGQLLVEPSLRELQWALAKVGPF